MSDKSEKRVAAAANEEEEEEDDGRIPMADEDAPEVAEEEEQEEEVAGQGQPASLTSVDILEADELSGEEQEEKARLIAQVLELQNTLDDLSSRVDNVKEENLRLRSENQVIVIEWHNFTEVVSRLFSAFQVLLTHHFDIQPQHF